MIAYNHFPYKINWHHIHFLHSSPVPYTVRTPRLCYLANSSEMHMNKCPVSSLPTVAEICLATEQ